MNPRKVVITGGSGFVGRRVVARALKVGWQVVNVALPGEALPPQWDPRVESIGADLSDPSVVERLPHDADAIVHLAAPVGVAGEYERQWRVMVEGTRHVLAHARRGVRVVVVSSIAVYGDRIRARVCHESHGFGAWQGAYGRAKQGKETLARELAARDDFELAILRPANVYGLGGASAWGDKLLDLLRATGGAVFGDAEHHNAGLVHVENLADALWLATTRPEAAGATFNVCDGLDVSWRRFFDDMAALAGLPPPPTYPIDAEMAAVEANEDPARLLPPRDPALPSQEGMNLIGFDNRIDSNAIRAALGWYPRVSYASAMAEMREMLLASGAAS